MTTRFNNLYLGLTAGIIVPLITLLGIYLVRYGEAKLSLFLKLTFEYKALSGLISLTAIPDALLFFIFIWTDKLKSARGVIFSLLLISFLVVIIKLTS